MQHLRNILLPTDFSDGANDAMVYAINLAQGTNTTLFILHVKEQLSDQEIENHFSKIKHHYLFGRNVRVEFLIATGNISKSITKQVKQQQIDLIIVGTAGAKAIRGMVSGSITARLIDILPAPIISVPIGCDTLSPKHISIASDNSSIPHISEMYVLNFLAEAFNSRIDIIHINSDPDNIQVSNEIKEAYDNLLEFSPHKYQIIIGENLIKEISDSIIRNNTDLLTVLHRRNRYNVGLERSTSKQLAFKSKIPLLIMPVN